MGENETKQNEFEGKTVDEAVAAAADSYGVAPDALNVEVVKSPGSIGSFLGQRVRIVATPKGGNNDFDPVEALTRIITTIMPEASVETNETADQLLLEIIGHCEIIK